jgi:small subunit ribosomal protein S4
MKIGPKYKIARRLGAPIFEKTQTQKFQVRSQRNTKATRPRPKSDFALGLMEKQKARFTYGITERQFARYVAEATAKEGNSSELLVRTLESRLDNVVLRAGFAPTRQAARQMVSHNHITVNGVITNIPSMQVKVGDIISIREGSKSKGLFAALPERLKTVRVPAWMKVDPELKKITVDGAPFAQQSELMFNVGTILEFYSR